MTIDGTAASITQVAAVGNGATPPASFFFEAAGTGSNSFDGATDAFYLAADTEFASGSVLTIYKDGAGGFEASELLVTGESQLTTSDSSPRWLHAAPDGGMYVAYYKSSNGQEFGMYTPNGTYTRLIGTPQGASSGHIFATNYSASTGQGDGTIWFVDGGNRLVSFTPGADSSPVSYTADMATDGFSSNSPVVTAVFTEAGALFGSAKGASRQQPFMRTLGGDFVKIGPEDDARQMRMHYAVALGDGSFDVVVQVDSSGHVDSGVSLVQLYRANPVSGSVRKLPIGPYYGTGGQRLAFHNSRVVAAGADADNITEPHGVVSSTEHRGLRIYDPETDAFSFAPLRTDGQYLSTHWNMMGMVSTDTHLFVVGNIDQQSSQYYLLFWNETANEVHEFVTNPPLAAPMGTLATEFSELDYSSATGLLSFCYRNSIASSYDLRLHLVNVRTGALTVADAEVCLTGSSGQQQLRVASNDAGDVYYTAENQNSGVEVYAYQPKVV